RKLHQPALAPEPIGHCAEMAKIGTELATQIGARHDADIDLVAELGEEFGRRRADAVAARLVDARPLAEVALDRLRQDGKLLALEHAGKIAGIGVVFGDLLAEGRGVPRLQVRADLATPRAQQLLDRLVPLARVADRKIKDEGRLDAVAGIEP